MAGSLAWLWAWLAWGWPGSTLPSRSYQGTIWGLRAGLAGLAGLAGWLAWLAWLGWLGWLLWLAGLAGWPGWLAWLAWLAGWQGMAVLDHLELLP